MSKKIYKNVKVNDIRNFSNGHTEGMFIVSLHTQINHYEQINRFSLTKLISIF